MSEEKKDTSPMVPSRRVKRRISIEERNDPPTSLFDTKVEYPSDALPEWFAPLQPIVEDETFTSMVINLGNKVYYHIGLVEASEQLTCHPGAYCEANQSVKRLDGEQVTTTVHTIRQMRDGVVKSNGRLEGFTKDEREVRHRVTRLPTSDVWIEEYWSY